MSPSTTLPGLLRALGLSILLGGFLLALAGCATDYNNLPPPKNGGPLPGAAAQQGAPKPQPSGQPAGH